MAPNLISHTIMALLSRTSLMAALSVADDFTSVFAQVDFLECSVKKSALISRGNILSVLTKLKNSLGTNLGQFSTLIFELWFT